MNLSNIEIRFRTEGLRGIYEVYKKDKLQFALYHHVNKDGEESWKADPKSSSKHIAQKDVAIVGSLIESASL